MLNKLFKAQNATITDQGVFSAILATWSVDRMNEQIDPHAFDSTIEAWQSSGKMIPLHWDHEGKPSDIVGFIDPKSMMATEQGLYVEGQVDIEESESAREVWRSMKNNAVGLSFGYLIQRDLPPVAKGDPRKLLELDLFEGTITPAPVNADTRVLETKSMDEKAVWTAAYVNDLPDSSFLYVAPGGSKDADGKTTPRSLRYFPVKDSSGSVDLAHVRNALSRIPQAKVPDSVKSRASAAAQRMLAAARSLTVASELPIKPPEDVLKRQSEEAALEAALGRGKGDGPELEEPPNPEVEGSESEGDQSGNGSPGSAPARKAGKIEIDVDISDEAKEKLRAMYKALGVDPPDEVKKLIDWEEQTSVEVDVAVHGNVNPAEENGIEGDGAEEPEPGQRSSRDPLRREADMLALEHALGRSAQDGPALDPDPEPTPEPADEGELRKQSNRLALELALGGGSDDSQDD